MKTILPLLCGLAFLLTSQQPLQAQQYEGLVFKNPTLVAGEALKLNAVYRFNNVRPGTDAKVTISKLVGSARVTKIDDNSKDLGYGDAFQPEVTSPSGLGQSYAEFTIAFYEAGTEVAMIIDNVQATALDIDGSVLVKEFAEIDMNGGVLSYLTSTLDISVLNLLLKKFKGENILGIERNGIDTTALGNMFTVTNSGISSFTVTAGTNRIASARSAARQYSFFMKGFDYAAPIILPLDFVSFSAWKNKEAVNLKWVTGNEKNVSHFVIEKSADGVNYDESGVVFAAGNTNTTFTYTFQDKAVSNSQPVVYYRIRSVDIDGKLQYSEIRSIRNSNESNAVIAIATYPNPVADQVRVSIPAAWQGKKVVYEVVSPAGQVVVRKEVNNGSQTEALTINHLAKGYYILTASSNGETAQQKIIIQ